MTIEKKTEQPQDHPTQEAPKSPSSGRGADSALTALIKRRVPVPEEPPAADESEPGSR